MTDEELYCCCTGLPHRMEKPRVHKDKFSFPQLFSYLYPWCTRNACGMTCRHRTWEEAVRCACTPGDVCPVD